MNIHPSWRYRSTEALMDYRAKLVEIDADGHGRYREAIEQIDGMLTTCDGSCVLQVTPVCPVCGRRNAKWFDRNRRV